MKKMSIKLLVLIQGVFEIIKPAYESASELCENTISPQIIVFQTSIEQVCFFFIFVRKWGILSPKLISWKINSFFIDSFLIVSTGPFNFNAVAYFKLTPIGTCVGSTD